MTIVILLTGKPPYPSKPTMPIIPYATQRHSTGIKSGATCVSAHVASRVLLAFSQPVDCFFWPIKTLNWLVEVSKLHRHMGTFWTAECSYCRFAILWQRSAMYDTCICCIMCKVWITHEAPSPHLSKGPLFFGE